MAWKCTSGLYVCVCVCAALEIIAIANLSIEQEFLCLLNINILKVCILYLYQALHRWRIQTHHLIYFLQPSCEAEIVSNNFFSYIRKQFPSSSMIYPKLSHCTWWVEKEAGQLHCFSWDPYPSALLNFTGNPMVGAGSPWPLAFWWGCCGRLESRIAMGEEGEPRHSCGVSGWSWFLGGSSSWPQPVRHKYSSWEAAMTSGLW